MYYPNHADFRESYMKQKQIENQIMFRCFCAGIFDGVPQSRFLMYLAFSFLGTVLLASRQRSNAVAGVAGKMKFHFGNESGYLKEPAQFISNLSNWTNSSY